MALSPGALCLQRLGLVQGLWTLLSFPGAFTLPGISGHSQSFPLGLQSLHADAARPPQQRLKGTRHSVSRSRSHPRTICVLNQVTHVPCLLLSKVTHDVWP